MDKTSSVLIANERVPRPSPAPRLRLLIEWEPRHRVFAGNLADLILSRRVPQIRITARPVPFWNDVFVPSAPPWTSFLESMLLHLLITILFVWAQSRVWVSVKLFPQPDVTHRSITYYPPKQSFRAAEGRASSVRTRARAKQTQAQRLAQRPTHQPAIPVTPEQKPSLVTPPDIKQTTAALPNLPGSHAVTPMVPFSATAGSRRNGLAEPSAVVAPPPQVDQATARRMALPQASAVAPAPELAGPSAGRAVNSPSPGGLRVVPPAPSVQSPGNLARAGRLSSGLGSLSGAGASVVPPPPSVQGAGTGSRLDPMAAASQVVPPPPSVQNAGNSTRAGRLSSGLSALPGERPNVVPPPPSVQGAGKARLGSMAGGSSEVVPPPPSVQGSGNSGTHGRVASLSADGSTIVPPPPSVQGSGGPAGVTRLHSLSGAGSEVVPPSPSVDGAGNSGRGGRLAALSGDGSPVAPPPPPAAVAASSGGGGGTGKILEPMDPLPTDGASDTAAGNTDNRPAAEELPLGLLGVVFVAPGSSFFSNFEVFVAKRRVGKDKNKDEIQLIKLVYEFLPYQRRLSEYNLNNLPARVIKLKVTPDPSCDESLGQMIQPSTGPSGPAPESQKLPEALRSSDLNAVLPCYRTTAADFLKAMSRSH
jgi:hypothetical protein